MSDPLRMPASGPAWLPDFARSIVRLIRRETSPLQYEVADLPNAASHKGRTAYVSNEAGGGTIAFSDGDDWRRISDRAIVS